MAVFIGATIAPLKDRVKGSKRNKKGSASTSKGNISFSPSTIQSIKTITKGTDITLGTAKAVVRRGFGAFSSSHFPGMSRVGWGLARLKAFVRKSKGQFSKPTYVQDDDLL